MHDEIKKVPRSMSFFAKRKTFTIEDALAQRTTTRVPEDGDLGTLGEARSADLGNEDSR